MGPALALNFAASMHLFHSSVPEPSLNVSIVTEGQPITGQQYILTCIVTIPRGVVSPVDVAWLNSSGPITSGGGVLLHSPNVSDETVMLTLEFNPFRDVHEEQLRCEASTRAMAPPYTLQGAAEMDITATSKLGNVSSTCFTYIYALPVNCSLLTTPSRHSG